MLLKQVAQNILFLNAVRKIIVSDSDRMGKKFRCEVLSIINSLLGRGDDVHQEEHTWII